MTGAFNVFSTDIPASALDSEDQFTRQVQYWHDRRLGVSTY